MTTWYTADPHFNHNNIIKFCNRPFTDADHMNEMLILNWNERIAPTDTVHVIGDFGFGERDKLQGIFDRLNGIKHLYLGNHDKAARQVKGWTSVQHYGEITVDGHHIVLCHYAMRVWNASHRGSWMLYGHSHGTLPDDPNALSFDVGVDCHNYAPISTADVARIMAKKSFTPIDHHGRK